jgi:hypothetical protein
MHGEVTMKTVNLILKIVTILLMCSNASHADSVLMTPLPEAEVYMSVGMNSRSGYTEPYHSDSMGTLSKSGTFSSNIGISPYYQDQYSFNFLWQSTASAFGEFRTVEARAYAFIGGGMIEEDEIIVGASSPMLASAFSRMTYYVGLKVASEEHWNYLSDNGAAPVPVYWDVTGRGTTSLSGVGSASVTPYVRVWEMDTGNLVINRNPTLGINERINTTLTRDDVSLYSILPMYKVEISAQAYAEVQGFIVGESCSNCPETWSRANAYSTVDPYIFIDPNWEYADYFEIVVSEGINNSPAVPIPSAAWLLGTGLIGIVGIRRKFKK